MITASAENFVQLRFPEIHHVKIECNSEQVSEFSYISQFGRKTDKPPVISWVINNQQFFYVFSPTLKKVRKPVFFGLFGHTEYEEVNYDDQSEILDTCIKMTIAGKSIDDVNQYLENVERNKKNARIFLK